MERKQFNDLLKWKSTSGRMPLIIRGARQVGKTYLLKEFGKAQFPRYHYFNFEEDERLCVIFKKDLKPERILDELQLYSNVPVHKQEDLVIFDEIQRCPRALTALKYFCEEMKELAICAAGSLLGVNLNKESFPVGKVSFLDLYPLNFAEFLIGTGRSRLAAIFGESDHREPLREIVHQQLWDAWKHYLVIGGLPGVINIYNDQRADQFRAWQAVRTSQRDLTSAYVADMAKHCGKINALHIERLWQNVPAQLARTQDTSVPKFRFKDAVPGLRGYKQLAAPLDWLETARLILRASIIEEAAIPLAGYSRDNRFKQYFFDVGMLGSIGNIPPVEILTFEFGRYKGYMAENFVAQELAAAGKGKLYAWQGRTSEVEFVVPSDQGLIPWEVKAGSSTKIQSLKVYEERYQPPFSYVLSARNQGLKGNRYYIPIYAAGHMARL